MYVPHAAGFNQHAPYLTEKRCPGIVVPRAHLAPDSACVHENASVVFEKRGLSSPTPGAETIGPRAGSQGLGAWVLDVVEVERSSRTRA